MQTPHPGSPPLPEWLGQRLRAAGGSVPFRDYMEWVLHDPDHGAYGSGRLAIGPRGDFATAPSLGAEFAQLLAPQVAQWLALLPAESPLALVETGPGEGQLAQQLAEALHTGWPELAGRTELVLVEPNAGMARRQRQRLLGCPLPVRWIDFDALARAPLRGVVLAHEVLDALAIERIERREDRWCRQHVVLRGEGLSLEAAEPLAGPVLDQLGSLGLLPLDGSRPEGWCSELHPGLEPWLAACAGALVAGWLLVIDYAHEARRYYAPQRSAGTLMAYRRQQACDDPLREPGQWDLTAHLCLESLEAAARAGGWQPLGGCRQGEALLALGLASRLHALQQEPACRLAELLQRRESLLRLVDPAGLGDFRWLAFRRDRSVEGRPSTSGDRPLFLSAPSL
ncbi:class I SAM-dependent methyltransferase [Synechococcus sp. BA-132 BA5]|uniref:class I SAM-dependent methyltransferase n=1 Tax=Synechococcus sp. BA-132 BA5 TaxID=3110252 RepID=UPI002B216D67|nr:SAM-dependent methyltransferase [Synechococcus sp. BA-132 BA5]MEA5415880.1 SAM-dependent methyltransferase [Synechococcus sp. BA-132 BA5]